MGLQSRRLLLLCVLVVIAPAAWTAPQLTSSEEHSRKLGDALEFAIPLSALALTFVLDPMNSAHTESHSRDARTLLHLDGSPRHDLLLAAARSFVLTEGLKYLVDEKRPNGGSRSFPSGHTSISFTGAEFIRKEYGWWWGAPAYAAAAYVAWSRVDSKEHHPVDVIAGAAIGIAVNHDFGELSTRFGMLSVAPALLAAENSDRVVPGLNINLRY